MTEQNPHDSSVNLQEILPPQRVVRPRRYILGAIMCASATAQDLRIAISPVIEGHTDLRDFAKAAVVIGIAGTAYLGRRAFQDIRQSDIPPAVEIHIPQSAPEVSNIDQQG